MGLLDLFSGGGLKGLTSDLGQEGGLLSKFGMGKFPQQTDGGIGGLGGLGQDGGLLEKLQKLMPADGQGGTQDAQPASGQPTTPQPQGFDPTGLSGVIMSYLQKLRR